MLETEEIFKIGAGVLCVRIFYVMQVLHCRRILMRCVRIQMRRVRIQMRRLSI